MKKQFYLLVLTSLLFSYSALYAQTKHYRKAGPKSGFGVSAGINYASQSTSGGSVKVDVSSILGFNAGAYYNYFLFDFLAIQPELNISRKGVYWKDQFYNADDILTYIDVPVLIRYQPVRIFNIHAGPEFGYLVGATQKNLESGQKTKIMEYYNKYDLGLAFGIEVNLSFKVNVTIRYVLGMIPVTTPNQYDERWKNNLFQISAGYRITGK